MKLKSDIIKYGNDSLRIDYIKTRKSNNKTYVDVALIGKDAIIFDNQSDKQLTSRFYASKEHAQKIVLPVIRNMIKQKSIQSIKQVKPNEIFTRNEIRTIKERTENNNHTENYLFIATKIKSKTRYDLKQIFARQIVRGYLNGEDSIKAHILYQRLMVDLKTKCPSQYQEIYNSL